MAKAVKINYEMIKKLSLRGGKVIMNVDQVAKKLGCTRAEISKVIHEHFGGRAPARQKGGE